MNNNEICTTYEELLEKGYKEYIKDKVSLGNTAAILRFRAWGKEKTLRCFFETKEGKKIVLYAWWNSKNGTYTPKQSSIDFSKVRDGTEWILEIKKNKTGKLYWVNAIKV